MAHPTLLYKTYDKREHLDAPQYTRPNHRYRGPRESSKVNLEIDQLVYSIAKLSETYDLFQQEFEGMGSVFVNGGELPAVLGKDGEVVEVPGLNDIAAKVEQLHIRVNNMRESSEALGRFTELFQSRL